MSKSVFAGFARPYAHNMLERTHKNLAVTDLVGASRLFYGLDGDVHQLIGQGHLEFDLGQKVGHILRTSVELGMTFLPSETFYSGHGEALHAHPREGFTHLIELEGFDDGDD